MKSPGKKLMPIQNSQLLIWYNFLMDKTYDPKKFEKDIYALWEKSGAFKPKINKKKKPFTIILPPPNANAPLHLGHAMYAIEDVLVRYHRMLGDATLWLPGADHAGFETQVVYEKHLAKEGKSRFDLFPWTKSQIFLYRVSRSKSKRDFPSFAKCFS